MLAPPIAPGSDAVRASPVTGYGVLHAFHRHTGPEHRPEQVQLRGAESSARMCRLIHWTMVFDQKEIPPPLFSNLSHIPLFGPDASQPVDVRA